jgi:putative hydrolase of the HAD superfamily
MRAVIWDFDGTLGYRGGSDASGGPWTASLWEVLQAEVPGCGVTKEQLRPYMQSGFPWHEPDRAHTHVKSADAWWQMLEPLFIRAYVGVGFNHKRAQRFASLFRTTYLNLDRWCVYHDVIPVLNVLSAAGWTHVILSNHVPELGAIVRHLGLAPYFTKIFNSAETGYEKPNPLAFQIVLDALPDLQEVWMVGDSMQADVVGAMGVGIPAILVRRFSADARLYAETLLGVPVILSR